MNQWRNWIVGLCAVAWGVGTVWADQPSAEEQLWLEMINRFRADPVAELDILANYTTPGGLVFDDPSSDDPDIASALNAFSVNAQILRNQFDALTPAPPLAWSLSLNDSASYYSGVMIAEDEQSHTLDGRGLINRITTQSTYDFTGGGAAAENIFAFTRSVTHGHAGFVLDWGNSPTGIQNPPGHRNALISTTYREIGIAIEPENNPTTNVGPLVVTQHLAADFADGPFLTGVAYNNSVLNDQFYSVGEGLAGLLVEVFETGTSNLIGSTTTWDSGGYALDLPAGVYDVTFSAPGLYQMSTGIDMTGGVNVKLDAVDLNPKPGDANIDGLVTFADFAILQNHFDQAGTFSDGDFNGDGMVTFVDFSILQNHFDQSDPSLLAVELNSLSSASNQIVPEPGSLCVIVIGTILTGTRRGRCART